MTLSLSKNQAPVPAVWSAMPGWGISADLTPPELVELRRLRVLRKVIGYAMVVLVLLCGAGVFAAQRSASSAQDTLDAATDRTTTLTVERGKYVKVTQVEGAITAAQARRATVMATDVDTAKLFTRIDGARKGTIVLTSVTITIAPITVGSEPVPGANGVTPIGTVTLVGTARNFTDVAGFVARLGAMPGFVNVVPTTNTTSTGDASDWTATVQLTSAAYSKRFAGTTTGSTASTTTGSPTNSSGSGTANAEAGGN